MQHMKMRVKNMEVISEWVRQLAAYLILASVLENLIQKQKYIKYVRLVVGIILIILLAKPVFWVLKQDENYSVHLERYIQTDIAADSAYLNDISGIREQMYFSELETVLKRRITEIAQSYGLQTVRIEIEWSDTGDVWKPETMYIEFTSDETVSFGLDSPDIIRLRERLSNEFEMEKDNIMITAY